MLKIAIYDPHLEALRKTAKAVEACCQNTPGIWKAPVLFSAPGKLLTATRQRRLFDLYLFETVAPELSGMELIRQLRVFGATGSVAFVTSSKAHALEAFEVQALRYLTKPVDQQELSSVLNLAARLAALEKSKTVLANTASGRKQIALSSLVYVESRNHLITYHLDNGSILPGRTLRVSFDAAMAPLLAMPSFVHPHKSFLVNIDFVESLTPQSLLLWDGREIPVAKSRYRDVKNKYMDYFDLRLGG